MTKGRMEAFSDGVIAILITIMVLELKVPHGTRLARRCARSLPASSPTSQLRLPRHLLEQPPPHAPRARRSQRRDALGEPAPAVLAVARAVRHRLDGREPFDAAAHRRSTASVLLLARPLPARFSRTMICEESGVRIGAGRRRWDGT